MMSNEGLVGFIRNYYFFICHPTIAGDSTNILLKFTIHDAQELSDGKRNISNKIIALAKFACHSFNLRRTSRRFYSCFGAIPAQFSYEFLSRVRSAPTA